MMVDLRAVYRFSEERTRWLIAGLFALLAAFVALQSVLSPLLLLAAVVAVLFLVMTVRQPLATLAFLSVYLPFEPFLLKFMPDELYVFARYFSEGLIYVLALVVLWRVLTGKTKPIQTPLGLPFVLFLIVLAASSLVNFVPPSIAILGIRQIIRFILVFFIAAYLSPSKAFVTRLTQVMIAIVALESVLALAQAVIGGPLDSFLLPSDTRTIGDITLTAGTNEFWDPGSRVFATLGRYDQLGSFLYFFMLIGVGMLYERIHKTSPRELPWIVLIALPALVLTYSRASWFGFLFGLIFLGLYLYRDKRIAWGLAAFALVAGAYLGLSGLNVSLVTEAPGQTLAERFYETFSEARWRGEYYGLGRVYWYVQTPLTVIPSAPLFGVGPGQYGGGAAAALHNSTAYDRLGLPFGVYGTDGYIDDSWFSLWGETGTIGLFLFLWMYVALFVFAVRTWRKHDDPFMRSLAGGFAAIMIGVAFNAFLSTLFEIRTLAFYLWMYGGFLVALAGGRKSETREV
jgi:O-antigen ligase